MALPLLGAALSFSRRALQGAVLVMVSMLASLAFGVINHFVLISPDNIGCLPAVPGRMSFVVSACLVAASEAFGVVCAALACRQLSRQQVASAANDGSA